MAKDDKDEKDKDKDKPEHPPRPSRQRIGQSGLVDALVGV
jgi:hypothetical protein